MKTVVPELLLHEDNLFDEFSYVQKYCESKLEVWNKKMTMLLKSGVKDVDIFKTKIISSNHIL
jgi:hypothetical protein